MASDIRLILNGTNYYFAFGKGTSYTGSGTPWTAQNTTPFELANNSLTGKAWTPTVAVPARDTGPATFGGGMLAVDTVTYDPVMETIPIQVRGSTPKNRHAALQLLKRNLDIGLARRAAILCVEPDDFASTMNKAYFEILAADIQEIGETTTGDAAQRSTSDGRDLLAATLTIMRSPLAGVLQGVDVVQTLVNIVRYTNGVTVNTSSLTPTQGDLYAGEGQPMNIQVVPVSTATAARVYLASVVAVESDSSGWSSTAISGSYTSLGTATFTGTDFATLLTQRRVSARLFIRFLSISSSITRIRVSLTIGGGSTYYQWNSGAGLSSTATGRLVDCGDIPIPLIPGNAISGNPSFTALVEVTGAGNVQVSHVEVILYHEFCEIRGLALTSSVGLGIATYPTNDGRVILPFERARAYQYTSTTGRGEVALYGEAPKARESTSLWCYMLTSDEWGGTHNNTHTMDVTAQMAPLYRTWRGD